MPNPNLMKTYYARGKCYELMLQAHQLPKNVLDMGGKCNEIYRFDIWTGTQDYFLVFPDIILATRNNANNKCCFFTMIEYLDPRKHNNQYT